MVSEWRTKENGEVHRCSKGNVEMAFSSINLVKHALSVYTIEAFLVFKKEFITGAGHYHKELGIENYNKVFRWGVQRA